ncbi:MAG TPA: FAD:protein FMN transferase [Abditibacterium sp.]
MTLFRRRPSLFRHVAHFENVLGTSLEIQLVCAEETSGPRAEIAVLDEIDRLSAIFNAYDEKSELSRWQTSFENEIEVSSELAHVLAVAEWWKEKSRGAFNPAVEAMTRVWKRAELRNEAVSSRELEDLAARIGGPLWEVDEAKRTARRLTTLPVTLNSVAKGFILDRAASVGASVESVEEVLVNIGGDIRHIGAKEVPIAIADPRRDAENAIPAARIAVRNQGVATSGNYRRGFRVEERWFSHLLDPRTGWPVEKLVGVSVVAPDAMTADVLATVFSVLTTEESLKMADSLGNVGAFLVDETGISRSNGVWKQQLQRV